MNDDIRIQQDLLETFVQEILSALGVPDRDGRTTARRLVKAHLRGFDTHGLPCLPGYADSLEQGRINPSPELAVSGNYPWSAQVDGDNGLGQVAGTRAMELCLESADRSGIGCAAVKRSNHFGAASVYSLMALDHDCIGIVTSNASAVTAPFGAALPLMGTNPLSVAVPAGDLAPFVIDMATSEGARKKIRQALDEGRTIPAGWALDPEGKPTTDPKAALDGVMLPFGGMKGSAITLLTDILSGVFSGANFGGEVLSVFTNQERESGNGNFMLAVKIDAFMPADEFKARMDEELNRITALPPAKGFDRVLYPGCLECAVETERKANGIPLGPALVSTLQDLGRRFRVGFPC